MQTIQERERCIATLRKMIADLQTERGQLEATRRNRAEVEASVDAQVDAWLAQGQAELSRNVASLASGRAASALQIAAPATGGVAFVDIGPLLTAIAGPKAVRAAYSAALKALPAGHTSERLAAIQHELDRLEADEEAQIVESEKTASPIARRANARPEIVLALNEG